MRESKKKVLAKDQRATSRAIKELLERMRVITNDALELEVDVTFLGPPGLQVWPKSVQAIMLCLKEASKKLGVHFTYGASNLPVNKQNFRLYEPSYPAFFAEASRLQDTPKASTWSGRTDD